MATVTKPTKEQQEFIGQYWAAEARATGLTGTSSVRFRVEDRLVLASKLKTMLATGVFKNLFTAAHLVAGTASDGSTYDRHQWRMRSWLKEYDKTAKQPTTPPLPVQVQTKPAKPVEVKTASTTQTTGKALPAKPAVASTPSLTSNLQPGDELIFMTNSIDQVKSLCMVAMRRGLSREKIMSILNGGLKDASDNFENEKLKNELGAFLRERGITSAIAVEVLQKM